MKLPLADFYLIRIAHHASEMANSGEDIYGYLTIAIESQRAGNLQFLPDEKQRKIIDFRTDALMLKEMTPSCIRNRLFTWEEYSALLVSDQFVAIPDHYLEVDLVEKSLIDSYVVTIRHFIEPMLKKSYEFITRSAEFE
jgi:hypothetical protein